MIRSGWFLVLVLVLGGCATSHVPQLEPTKYRRIGVISLMGHEVQAKSVGWWAFANKSWRGDAREWEMNRFTRDTMVRSLQRRGFEAVAIDYDAMAWFQRYQNRTQGFTFSGIMSAYGADMASKEFAAEFKQAVAQHKLDALLVFVPGRDTLNQTSEAWIEVGDTGMGFRAAGEQAVAPYAMGFLYLIDARTMDAVRRPRMQAFGPALPIHFAAGWSEVSAEDREKLREAIRRLFVEELEPALGRL